MDLQRARGWNETEEVNDTRGRFSLDATEEVNDTRGRFSLDAQEVGRLVHLLQKSFSEVLLIIGNRHCDTHVWVAIGSTDVDLAGKRREKLC